MTKKIVFMLALMLSSIIVTISAQTAIVGSSISLQVHQVDPTGTLGGGQRTPVLIPMVSLDDHTLYIYDVAYDFTLMLVDENDDVVYSTFVPANTASVVLPSTLTGTYTLMLIPNGTYYFEGEIEL